MSMKTENVEDSLLADIGENFHYVKTLAKNTLEIKKLELVNEAVKISGMIIYVALLSIVAFVLFSILIVSGIYLLSQLLNSWLYALGLVSLFFIMALIILTWSRKSVINYFTYKLTDSVIS